MSITNLISSYSFALCLALGFSGCVSGIGDIDDSVGVGAGSDQEDGLEDEADGLGDSDSE